MKKVLVVEDDFPLRTSIKEILKLNDIDVLVASEGGEAWELLQKHTVDLVITDLAMAGKDGIWLIQQIKQNKPEIKYIVISGDIKCQKALMEAKNFDASSIFAKPFDFEEFVEVVTGLIED